MSALLRAVVDFWTKPVRAEPLALFRILTGSVGFLSALCSLAPHLNRYLGEDGLCPTAALDSWLRESGQFSLLRGPVGIPLLDRLIPEHVAQVWARWGAVPENAYLLFAIWLLSLATLALGWWTRASAFVAWALTVTFTNRLLWLTNGGDDLLRAGVFYLMLSPAGATWSLDRHWRVRRARRRGVAPPEPALIAPWPVRLMQIQIICVYLFTGLMKLGGSYLDGNGSLSWALIWKQDWLNGEAVYWVLNDFSLTRWPYARLPMPLLACRLLSWATLVFEIGFPVFVLFRRTRWWLLWCGVAFHLGILVHTEVGWFSPLSLCWYVLFLSGDLLVELRSRLIRRK
jgi:hypothetical protein